MLLEERDDDRDRLDLAVDDLDGLESQLKQGEGGRLNCLIPVVFLNFLFPLMRCSRLWMVIPSVDLDALLTVTERCRSKLIHNQAETIDGCKRHRNERQRDTSLATQCASFRERQSKSMCQTPNQKCKGQRRGHNYVAVLKFRQSD